MNNKEGGSTTDLKQDDDLPTRVEPICSFCFIIVASFAPQVQFDWGRIAHRDCFESFYFRKYSLMPKLVPNGQRQRFVLAKDAPKLGLQITAWGNFEVRMPDIFGNLDRVLIATD